MKKLQQWMVNFIQKEDGPTAVEYAVMLALIIVVCITAITAVGNAASGKFQSIATVLAS
jgi:pilus assembly protein Flp/PilA